MNPSQNPDKILTAVSLSVGLQPVYTFADFILDPAERTLVHKGEVVPLTPKVFEALLLLVQNSGRLVEKEEFMRRLWPDTFVGDDTLAQNISLLRKALADGTNGPSLVTTVPRLGYRFTGTVQEQIKSNGSAVKSESVEPPSGNELIRESRKINRLRFPPLVLIAAAVVVGTLAGLITYSLMSVPALPRFTRSTQITHSGRVDPWGT